MRASQNNINMMEDDVAEVTYMKGSALSTEHAQIQ